MVVHLAGWMAAYLEKQMVEQRVGLMGQLKVVHLADLMVPLLAVATAVLRVPLMAGLMVALMVEKLEFQ